MRNRRLTRSDISLYNLVFRQSCIKQQSMFEHWPFDHPKQGVHPSAVCIAWIRSAFFILPGVIPRPFAFFFISGIPIRLCATFVAAILCLLLLYSRQLKNTLLYNQFYPSNSSSPCQNTTLYISNIYASNVEKKCRKIQYFCLFLQNFCGIQATFHPFSPPFRATLLFGCKIHHRTPLPQFGIIFRRAIYDMNKEVRKTTS